MELQVIPTSTRAEIKATSSSNPSDVDNKYTANVICQMPEFLVENMHVRFGGLLFRQTVGTPMESNCAPSLADLFL